jgi:flagellin-like protein
MNKRGMSPIIATILLIAFAVAIGAMIMNWSAGITEDEVDCSSLPSDIINQDGFCKMQNKLIPRIISHGEATLCEENAVNWDLLPSC